MCGNGFLRGERLRGHTRLKDVKNRAVFLAQTLDGFDARRIADQLTVRRRKKRVGEHAFAEKQRSASGLFFEQDLNIP